MTHTAEHPSMYIKFKTVLVGKLDAERIELVGSGTINETAGLTQGVFDIAKIPEDVDPRALGAFLFTGYPNSCRTNDAGISNPFSGGDYSYKREYFFSRSQKRARLEVECKLRPSERVLTSEFKLSGAMPRLGPVHGVSPIYEMWTPVADHIEGSFSVAWLDIDDGQTLETALARSQYSPVGGRALQGRPKHRFIRLDSEVDASGRLHVIQRSNLLDQEYVVY